MAIVGACVGRKASAETQASETKTPSTKHERNLFTA
jgi:hypothetical protein